MSQFTYEMLQPGIVGVTGRRHTIFPSMIILLNLIVTNVERRVSQNIVNLCLRKFIIEESIPQFDLCLNTPYSKIHPSKFIGSRVTLLPEDAYLALTVFVHFYELFALHKHTPTATTTIIYPLFCFRSQHFNK